jgi:hypothetical protein
MSWISLRDLLNVFDFVIHNHALHGPVNAVSPEPVTNQEFVTALARALKRPVLLRVPAFALRLLLGEMADEMLLASARAVPWKLQEAGFAFRYRDIRPVLEAEILGLRGER